MKNISFAVCALLIAHCSDSSIAPVSDNTVSLTFIAATESEAELELSNTTDSSIFYLGYSKSTPLKRVEVLSDTGWTTVAWDWCATGASSQEVLPNESVIVYAPVMRRNVTTRVLFGYHTQPEGDYVNLVSNEFIVP